MARQNGIFGLFFGFVVAVAFVAGGGYLWVSQNEDVENYEPVEATVVSSEVDTVDGEDRPDITYEYAVDGRTYESSNVFPGIGESPADDPEGLVRDHPEGATVTAYYDPANPSNAYLVQRTNLLFPVALIGIGGLVALAFGGAIAKRLLGLVF